MTKLFSIFIMLVLASSVACGGAQAKKQDQKTPPQGGTTNQEAIKAFETAVGLYEKGGPQGLSQARKYLETAVDEDPNLSLIHISEPTRPY